MRKILVGLILISLSASAQVNISPNMNLPIPIPGVTQGPAWANSINSSFLQIDSHNHSFGQGVQIQPNGINISSDLTFNSNNATNLRTTRFSAQASPITSAAPDVGAVYVSGNELYYNDVSGGHQIQITSNGSVNSGAGSITGLPSGTASASFSAGTFIWQSATNTAANMDAQSYILRNSGANSHGLTLQAPAAMASNFSLTLPTVPGATSFVTLDTSGNFGAAIATSGGLTTSNLSASAGIVGTQLANNTITATQITAGTITSNEISSSAGILSTQLASPTTWTGSGGNANYASGSTNVLQITSFIPNAVRPVFFNFSGGQITIPTGWSITLTMLVGLHTSSTVTIDNTAGTAKMFVPISSLNQFSVPFAVGSTHTATLSITINTSSTGIVSIGSISATAMQL